MHSIMDIMFIDLKSLILCMYPSCSICKCHFVMWYYGVLQSGFFVFRFLLLHIHADNFLETSAENCKQLKCGDKLPHDQKYV